MNTWSSTLQARRIFGWSDILRQWSVSNQSNVFIDTLLENLNASLNQNFPVQHFLTFLNHEEAGIKWLIYEIVANRWMNGTVRTDYLAELVERVDLESHFPPFVGSPGDSLTVREFLNGNLTSFELGQIAMMPPLVNFAPTRARRQSRFQPPVVPAPAPAVVPVCAPLRKTPILFRIMRDSDNQDQDDIITIRQTPNNTYFMHYNDQSCNKSSKMANMTRAEVLTNLSVSLRLLAIDEKPFDSLQVIVPNVPSVMISPENLTSQARDLIYDTVESIMDNWPVEA
jgi:hypothetical protein